MIPGGSETDLMQTNFSVSSLMALELEPLHSSVQPEWVTALS